jgi:putative ABC transport system permease protein
MSKMQLLHANGTGPPPRPGENSFPCPASTCLAGPVIQEVRALPSGTSAPNTVITEHAVRQLHLHVSTAAWLIQARGPLTSTQIHDARQAAAAAGLIIETRNSVPSLSQITDVATVFGILLALGILAMSVGLIRSETDSDLRTLAATGASGPARRTVTAATAGALALTGAVTGLAGGYLVAIGFFRTSHLDGLSSLSSIPVASLLLILVGMPALAVIAGWLLAGREPSAMGRQPLS